MYMFINIPLLVQLEKQQNPFVKVKGNFRPSLLLINIPVLTTHKNNKILFLKVKGKFCIFLNVNQYSSFNQFTLKIKK